MNDFPFEMHLPGHNFTGPGTKLYKRLNSDGKPNEWSMPINRVGNAAYHDLYYSKQNNTKTSNQVCNKTMLNELNETMNSTLRERIDKSIVGKLINAKVNLGLGAPTKAKKILNFTDELAENSINQSSENFGEGESTSTASMKIWLLI